MTIALTAPAVLNRRQTIDRSSAGKFALHAIANARPTMNATFWPLKTMPSSTASRPKTTVATRATRALFAIRRLAAADDVHEDVVREGAGAGKRQAGDDRKDRRERHGDDEPEKGVPPRSSATSGAAMLPPASTLAMSSRPTSADAPNPTIGMIR